MKDEFIKLSVMANYSQFYLIDSQCRSLGLAEDVTQKDIEDGFMALPDGIVFYTPNSGMYTVEIHTSRNATKNHLREMKLSLNSGSVFCYGCMQERTDEPILIGFNGVCNLSYELIDNIGTYRIYIRKDEAKSIFSNHLGA